MGDELRACPFCGGKADYVGQEGMGYWVQCTGCDARGSWGDYGYQALAAWNTRPAERDAEGWVLVPPVPTDAMLKAWFGAKRPKHIISNERYFGCYMAMLEARPLPTTAQDSAK